MPASEQGISQPRLMGKDILNFLGFVESYIIKYNNISPPGVIMPYIQVDNMKEIQEGAAFMGALGYIAALVSEIIKKERLVNKEEGAISKLLKFLEALSVFSSKLDIGWVF